MEKARNADSSAEGTADSCDAWMQIAGGETSAERPGTTRMMFLVVFFARQKKFRFFRKGLVLLTGACGNRVDKSY